MSLNYDEMFNMIFGDDAEDLMPVSMDTSISLMPIKLDKPIYNQKNKRFDCWRYTTGDPELDCDPCYYFHRLLQMRFTYADVFHDNFAVVSILVDDSDLPVYRLVDMYGNFHPIDKLVDVLRI